MSESTHQLRAGLPELPARMRHLSIDERGYPVPYFVAWIDGKPDHRVMDGEKLPGAIKHGLCWQCGQQLGKYKSFCIGPMCSITRTIAEPPSHLECLRFAVQACPWMTRPHARRRDKNLPEDALWAAGDGIKRNPGAACIWTTRRFVPFKPPGGGVLFELGDPEHTEWYAEGRPATRAEVDASIASGLPLLFEPAEREDAAKPGRGAMAELKRRIAIETAWLDRQVWPEAAA
jgi:hypothetical protein